MGSNSGDAYAVEFNGECMGELIEHGAILSALPSADVRPLDLVSVLLDGFTGPWAPQQPVMVL